MKRLFSLVLALLVTGASLRAASPEEKVYQVVVMGGGVGALTSAVYLQRAGIETLVIEGDSPGGAIAQSPSVQNWPGENDISGDELVGKIRNQAETNGAEFRQEKVVNVDFSHSPYTVTTQDVFDSEKKSTIKTRAVIIATGSSPRKLQVPGENKYWTKGVYSCATCDGSLYKDRVVAVVGGGDSAILEADYLSNIAKKVYIVVRSSQFKTVEKVRKEKLVGKENVEVLYGSRINEILGNGEKVTGVSIEQKRGAKVKKNVDAVFLAIGANPNSSLFKDQITVDQDGYISLIKDQQTSKRGVYAIGDVVDPFYKQAVSAAGDGAKAAMQVEGFLAGDVANSRMVPKVKTVANQPSGEVKEITSSEQFYRVTKGGDRPVLVDFYSPYCGPCRQLAPRLDKSAKEYAGKVDFYKMSVSTVNDVAMEYNVYAVPTVIVFDQKGKIVSRKSGLDDINKLLKNLDNVAK